MGRKRQAACKTKKKKRNQQRKAIQVKRQSKYFRELERIKERESKRINRKNEPIRDLKRLKDKESKRIIRKNVTVRELERIKDIQSKQEKRSWQNKTWEQLVNHFISLKNEYASCMCLSCGGMFFKKSIDKIILNPSITQFLAPEMLAVNRINGQDFICKTCHIDIKLQKIPKLSITNGLNFPRMPDELKGLTSMEERLVALRIPFMQIRSKTYAGEKCLKGNIVNVPNNFELNTKIVPRMCSKQNTMGVMLFRQMSNKIPYMMETIRVSKVKEAAEYLCKTPLYIKENIAYYEEWDGKCISELDDKVEQLQDDSSSEDEPEEIEHTVVNNPESLIIGNNDWMEVAVKIAPGQGVTPLSILLDNNCEELSFPSVFCGHARKILHPRISYTDIVKSETRNHDRRATKPVILLYKYRKLIYENVLSQIGICLRKKKRKIGERITASDVMSDEGIKKLIDHDDGYRLLQNIRSSPPFWEAQKKKVMAMIRQLGQPTFFITLSAAETKWPELLNTLYFLKHEQQFDGNIVENLTFVEKMELINSDPVTCVQHYNHRLQSLLQLIIKPKNGVFYPHDLLDYYWRYESQHRGSLHTHMILWLKDAPKFDTDKPETILQCVKFVDTFITTERVEDTDAVADIIQYQIHKHNVDKEVKQGNYALRERLRKIGNTFNNFSEINQQEAALGCLGIDMVGSSVGEIFVNTSPPQERVRLLKSREELIELSNDSEEILAENVVERYIKRPVEIENLTLASFATKYTLIKALRPFNIDEKKIKFNNQGYLIPRKRPLILRYRRYGEEADPLNYYREMLMLFYPWRNEEAELLTNTSQKYFQPNVFAQISEDKKEYHSTAFGTDVEAVEFSNENSLNDPNEPWLYDERTAEDYLCDVLEDLGLDRKSKNIKQILAPKMIDETIFRNVVKAMNSLQKKIFLDCVHRIRTGQLPFYKFVSGGAGVGKTYVILALVQAILRICNRIPGQSLDDIFVLVCAPTGKAAFNVLGMTLHHAFRLPPNQLTGKISHLDPSSLNSMRVKMKHLKLLIIDEISMVSNTQFHQLDHRMRQIFEVDSFFGRKSVIIVGHFRQLPPVRAKYCFQPLDLPLAGINSQPFDIFHLNELVEIMRTKNQQFCIALNNLAEDRMTPEDVALFKSRVISEILQPPKGAQHLFYRHKDCDDHNIKVHNEMPGDEHLSIAIDRLQIYGKYTEKQKENVLAHAKSLKTNDADGLPERVNLKENARFSVTTNIDVEDGIFNGGIGILKQIIRGKTRSDLDVPPKIKIFFVNPIVGAKKRGKIHNPHTENDERCWTLIEPFTRILQQAGRKGGIQVVRTQIPVQAADGITVHYSQGSDLYCFVLYLKYLTRQLLYTGCSRAPTLEDLFLLGVFEDPPHLPENDVVTLLMKKLREECLKNPEHAWNLKFLQDCPSNKYKLIFLNIQSVISHFEDIICDECFNAADLLVFVEPWLKMEDAFVYPGFSTTLRKNCSEKRNSAGVLVLQKADSDIKCKITSLCSTTKDMQLEVHCLLTENLRIVILYCPPSFPVSLLRKTLEPMLDANQNNIPTAVIGDFNIDFFLKNSISNLFQEYGYIKRTENYASTKNGSQIDVCFANTQIEAWYYESLFTYHEPICVTWDKHTELKLLNEHKSLKEKYETANTKLELSKNQETEKGLCKIANQRSVKKPNCRTVTNNFRTYNPATEKSNAVLSMMTLDIMTCQTNFQNLYNTTLEQMLLKQCQLIASRENYKYQNEAIDTISEKNLPKGFTSEYKPVYTIGDGDCFYRAVSWCLFGDQNHHALIRLSVFLELLINREEYINFLASRFSVNASEDYLRCLNDAKTLGAWATEIHVFIASKIIRRPINIYHFLETDLSYTLGAEDLHMYFNSTTNLRLKTNVYFITDISKEPICIHFRGGTIMDSPNHFVALLPTENSIVFKCNYNEFVNQMK